MDVLFEPSTVLRAKRDYASISLFLFIRGRSWQPERGNGLGKVSGPVMCLQTPQPVSLLLLLIFRFAMPSSRLSPGRNWASGLGADQRGSPLPESTGWARWALLALFLLPPAVWWRLNCSLVRQQHPESLLLPLCHCRRIPLEVIQTSIFQQ